MYNKPLEMLFVREKFSSYRWCARHVIAAMLDEFYKGFFLIPCNSSNIIQHGEILFVLYISREQIHSNYCRLRAKFSISYMHSVNTLRIFALSIVLGIEILRIGCLNNSEFFLDSVLFFEMKNHKFLKWLCACMLVFLKRPELQKCGSLTRRTQEHILS